MRIFLGSVLLASLLVFVSLAFVDSGGETGNGAPRPAAVVSLA